ncbi:B-cell linker protein [Liparis tanakae]|uniref:B-cell linker protein n=1 Tax=Liparis tanakae TaxID=230148 RepID=A0A4Z2HLT8_9TELE|nr:B-cell linker protein [Liparis tanakae]
MVKTSDTVDLQLHPGGQDDEEEEDGDTYEVPPCERQTVTVPQSEVEENVYLGSENCTESLCRQRTDTSSSAPTPRTPRTPVSPERMSLHAACFAESQGKPTPPQRPAALPPRPTNPSKPQQRADDFSSDPKTKKAPEINRTEKPGRKMMMPPSPVRGAPVPEAASNTEEDVYLDPNEEQEDSDDVYVEPTAACTPATRAPIRVPPSPNTGLLTCPMPNSLFPSSNELKTASSGGMKTTKQSGLEDNEWFAGSCNRKTAIDLLLRLNKDGAFLIRHSSAQGGRQPYTLAVLYQQKVYNIPIRFLGETRGYALGKEGKKNEEVFGTLDEMISHHKNNQLLLIDSQSQAKRTTYLTYPARP